MQTDTGASQVRNLIVGTAGHVDHGKTALIKRLTGVDTDRLQEEKIRGISIDLGFASLNVEEFALGIVDVPGHEKFLKNMLAGTGGIDIALLIVAADEGIMPQTREHLDMLCCFGIRQGLIVMTKIDKVEQEWLLLIEEEINALVEGSFLQGAPICPVSSFTGEGVETLKEKLAFVCRKVSPREIDKPFHMWIDRAFHVKGHGLVVTGSLLEGAVSVGDSATLYPAELPVKIRGIETHGSKSEKLFGGQRAAINLAGISIEDVGRGTLLAFPGSAMVSLHWECVIVWKTRFPSGTRVRVHCGTGEFIGRLSYHGEPSAYQQFVRLHAETPVPGAAGMRGIVRRYSPPDLIGSLILMTPLLSRVRESADAILSAIRSLDEGAWEGWMHYRLQREGGILLLDDWITKAGYFSEAQLKNAVAELVRKKIVLRLGELYILATKKKELLDQIRAVLQLFHVEHPEQNGISRETLRQRLGRPDRVLDLLIKQLENEKIIEARGDLIASVTYRAAFVAKNIAWLELLDKEVEKLENLEINAERLMILSGLPLVESQKAFERLVRDGQLVRVGGIHVYRKTIQYIVNIIHTYYQTHETMSVGELRDLLATSRKTAVPVMEYLDANKYTFRKGDIRIAGPNLKP